MHAQTQHFARSTRVPLTACAPSSGTTCVESVVDFDIHIHDHSDATLYAGVAQDSVLGVFVPTYRSLRPRSLVAVRIHLPDEGEPITAMTSVRWTRDPMLSDAPPGLGLAFLRLRDDARLRLENYVQTRPPLLYEA